MKVFNPSSFILSWNIPCFLHRFKTHHPNRLAGMLVCFFPQGCEWQVVGAGVDWAAILCMENLWRSPSFPHKLSSHVLFKATVWPSPCHVSVAILRIMKGGRDAYLMISPKTYQFKPKPKVGRKLSAWISVLGRSSQLKDTVNLHLSRE